MVAFWLNQKLFQEETETTIGTCVGEKQRLNRRQKFQAINPEASKKVTEYMVATSEEGFMGGGATTATIPDHRIAVKSGTAQISRPIVNADGTKTPCGPECNTKLGLYDHSFIGYNISGKRYIVMIKLAEPRPGVENNFASTTLVKHFNEMMSYTMDYFGVSKDK
jgi:cell division protein FtsI/penicillin-binding protein 2